MPLKKRKNTAKQREDRREEWKTQQFQVMVGIDPSVTQAVSAASGVWQSGLVADQLRWRKLTKGQAKQEDMAELSMKRNNHAKQLVVFFGAVGIGARGGWGADAMLRACCKVVSQAATQPAASEPGPSTPPPAKPSKRAKDEPAAEPSQPSQPTKGKDKAQGKAAKAKPAPQPGRRLRDKLPTAQLQQPDGTQ
ncbi:hypothetical protein HaLaN_29541 [Haematococcus lacustris]|uniref:Uncharacterized protein n=1 Tax=Haematococcus lacustris TaxID=44745 RepID=A0A6A0ADJ4_HAELA|nr:hypothetical protein HaLaN_29541 [Haematococcus lacustris]